jgi:PadR family transcriptional regulator PadR
MRQMRSAEPADSGDTSGFKNLLKRATTEMLVLLLLRRESMYTYEMMNKLERYSGGYLSFNTLYIAVYRLKELLFIEESGKTLSDDNRVRVYFSITDAGRKYLDNLIAEYNKFSEVVDIIMSQGKIGKIS